MTLVLEQGKQDYAFAARKRGAKLMRDHVLLDNQSSVHVMYNPSYVNHIQKSLTELQLKSNGGILPLEYVANFAGIDHDVWFNDNDK